MAKFNLTLWDDQPFGFAMPMSHADGVEIYFGTHAINIDDMDEARRLHEELGRAIGDVTLRQEGGRVMPIIAVDDLDLEFEGAAATGRDDLPIALKFGAFVIEMSAEDAMRCRQGLTAAIGLLPGLLSFDLVRHLHRQRAFSQRTFGPGARAAGICDHIRKELAEIEAEPGELGEWVDVILLALDGAWRTGAAPEQIAAAIVAKQTRNEGRGWPDWRTQDPDRAIEHDRSAEVA